MSNVLIVSRIVFAVLSFAVLALGTLWWLIFFSALDFGWGTRSEGHSWLILLLYGLIPGALTPHFLERALRSVWKDHIREGFRWLLISIAMIAASFLSVQLGLLM